MYGNTAMLIQPTLVDLMCKGVCQKFPDLKFVVAEFNAGWLAYWLDRIEQGWKREYGADPSTSKPQQVRELWKKHFYITIENDQAALNTRHLFGEDTLLWGSDYPHTDSTWPCSVGVLEEMFSDFSLETKTKITCSNVRNLYQLPE